MPGISASQTLLNFAPQVLDKFCRPYHGSSGWQGRQNQHTVDSQSVLSLCLASVLMKDLLALQPQACTWEHCVHFLKAEETSCVVPFLDAERVWLVPQHCGRDSFMNLDPQDRK